MNLTKKVIVITTTSFLFSGCGGGSSDTSTGSSTTNNPNLNNPESFALSGGTPSSPVTLSLTKKNEINNNPFYNYFKYFAEKNEKIIISANLTIPLTDQQHARCSSNLGTGNIASSFETQIHIYDKSLNRISGICGDKITYIAPSAGEIIVNFEFPYNGYGFFNVASVRGDSAITAPSGDLGTPNAPKQLATSAENQLNANSFYNYYKFTIEKNKKLIINTQLNQPLSDQQKRRCSANDGRGVIPSSYDTQIHIYNRFYERVDGICGENLTFIAPETGTYIINFSFGTQSAGIFYVDQI